MMGYGRVVMMDAHEDPFGSRLHDPAFASALDGYLAIVARRARAARAVTRRLVILPAGERMQTTAPRQKTAG
jgi:hypothetical protein